jgi:hypothetical protein
MINFSLIITLSGAIMAFITLTPLFKHAVLNALTFVPNSKLAI